MSGETPREKRSGDSSPARSRRTPGPAGRPERAAAELAAVLRSFLLTRKTVLAAAADSVAASLSAGGKILVFGNGGSAAEAQHFAAELVNGLSRREAKPRPAIALSADTSALTSIGNDRGFDRVFSRQIEALGRPGDIALALSTSGRSRNVLRALRAARTMGLVTIALTGRGGGAVDALADILLDVPSCSTARIQEVHLFILHELAGRLETALP